MQHSKCLIPHTFRVFFFGGGKFSMLFAEAALVIYFVVDHVGWLKQARLCFLPDFWLERFVKFGGSPWGEEWLQDNSAWPQMACSFQFHLSEPHLHLFLSKDYGFSWHEVTKSFCYPCFRLDVSFRCETSVWVEFYFKILTWIGNQWRSGLWDYVSFVKVKESRERPP